MAVNRYDEAAPVQYVSQYVPIPFQEILTLSKYYGDEIKAAEKLLQEHAKTYGDFWSESKVDMENYRKESIDKVTAINEAAANPELLKSAAWRSKMQGQINSIDYGLLRRFKKTAENAELREKAKAELKAKGLYEEWFDDPMYRDLSNWNTMEQGVMMNLSPDKYTTMEELGERYVKNLLPTFYKGVSPNTGLKLPFHNWLAISYSDIRRQFEDRAQDLLSTDAGAKHYARLRLIMKSEDPNVSEDDILNTFIHSLTVEQSDRLIETPVLDTAALQKDLYNTRYGKSDSKKEALPYIFPTSVSYDQQLEIDRRTAKIEKSNPELASNIKADDNKWAADLAEFYAEMTKDPEIVKIMKRLGATLDAINLMKDVDRAQTDPTFLNAFVTGTVHNLPKDEKYNSIRQKYQELQASLFGNAFKHNNQLSSAIISNTLTSLLGDGVADKYKENPWLAIFEEPSNAMLNAIDKAALSTVETNLNIPEQMVIAKALFGDDHIIPADMLKSNALSSYQWIMKNYTDLAMMANSARDLVNYTRSGSPVVEITGSWLNRNINSSSKESYSIRDNAAKGLYGGLEIASVDGFAPVIDPGNPNSNQYTYRVTVRVPLSQIDKDLANNYYTWMSEDLMDYNTVTEDTGLTTEVVNGIEYVNVPIFINRNLNDRTKGYMDSIYRELINSSTDLDKANEEKLAIANPQASSF